MNFWTLSTFYFTDLTAFQLITSFCIFLFIYIISLYYTLLYLFSWISLSGLVLCYCNNELAAGFLWATEVLVIFIFLLMLFYINNLGDNTRIKVQDIYPYLLLSTVFIIFSPYTHTHSEFSITGLFDDLLWVNYYESLQYLLMNDFLGFFIAFYRLNAFILLIIGYLLYIGSLVCVMLFSSIKKFKFNSINNAFDLLALSQLSVYLFFCRKQDLFEQNLFFAVLNKSLAKYD